MAGRAGAAPHRANAAMWLPALGSIGYEPLVSARHATRVSVRFWLLALLVGSAACAAGAPPMVETPWPESSVAGPGAAGVRPARAPHAAPSRAPAPAEGGRGGISEAVSKAPAGPHLSGPFPPPGFESPHARTRKASDGQWRALAEGAEGERATIYRAQFHPDKYKRFVNVTLMAFDLNRLALHMMAGTDEPAGDDAAPDKRTGLVPRRHHDPLVALFNGGFKARHGRYGMMVGGQILAPPRDDACAIGIGDDGRVTIASWQGLSERASRFAAWRQTPPCLVEGGAINARLAGEFSSRTWGAAEGGNREIRRSAVGLMEGGRTLIYAFGEWTTAQALARALKGAGVVAAAELDINWSYTRFYFFEHGGSTPRIRRSIIPKAKYSPNRYTEKPSYRDFFYVVRRE